MTAYRMAAERPEQPKPPRPPLWSYVVRGWRWWWKGYDNLGWQRVTTWTVVAALLVVCGCAILAYRIAASDCAAEPFGSPALYLKPCP